MICINDYKDLKVGDEFINKYDRTLKSVPDEDFLCRITDIRELDYPLDFSITFEYLEGPMKSYKHRFSKHSVYSEHCYIFNRNKNLEILLNDSSSTTT